MLVWDVAGATLEVPSSYVGDALGELMQTALDLKKGGRSSFCHFLGEPGGYRMFFSGADAEVYVQVVRFPDLQSEGARWAGGTVIWAGRILTNGFIESVIGMGNAIIHDLGIDGYRKIWGKPFPVELLSALQSAGSS
jgi:hypothetical protein